MKATISAVVLIYCIGNGGKQNNFVVYEKTQLDADKWWKWLNLQYCD